jgi:hypothetical protein
MVQEKNSYPMLSVTVWHKLRQQFKKKIPSAITNSYLASILGISEGSARTNVVAPLKLLGFIEEGNKANTDLIVEFRDDGKYPKFCEKLVSETYPDDLTDAFPDSSSDKTQIQNWFMTTGVGQAAAKRAAAFYYELLLANPDKEVKESTAKPKIAKPKDKATPASKQPKQNEKTKESNEGNLAKLNQQLGTKNNMTINLNIQLTVPETTDEEVYNKFFEAMKKHLLS